MDYAALASQFGGTTSPASPSAPAGPDYAALAKQFGGTTEIAATSSVPSRMDQFAEGLKNSIPVRAGAGIYRGFRDVSDTLIGGAANLADKVFGGTASGDATRADASAGKANYDARYGRDAVASAGRMGGNVLATLPVGGALAAPVKAAAGYVPALAPLGNALASAGFTTGTAAGPSLAGLAANLGTRAAGGAVTGGATMGLIDPEHAGTGAVVGAVLPPALKALGAVAQPAGNAIAKVAKIIAQPRAVAGAEDITKALEASTPAELRVLIDTLRGGETLVQGSSPTVAESLLTPQASILQRVVHDSPGSRVLRDKIVAQAEARMNALESVAPVHATGIAEARTDLGNSVQRTMVPEHRKLADLNSQAFEQIDPAQVARFGLPLEDMQGALDKYLGPGTFGQGGKARQAMVTANDIGTETLPAISVSKAGQQESLLDAVKRAGGINESTFSAKQLAGEVGDLRQAGIGRVVYKNRGMSLDRMTEKMHEAGFLKEQDPVELLDLLRSKDASSTYSHGAGHDSLYRVMADASMGGVPEAATIPRQVPWSELQNLRVSIGDAWKAATAKEGMSKEAAALNAMKRSLDKEVMNAATGSGKPGDFMPADVVAKWLEANKSYAALMDRFHTGPQAGIFRMGGDGQPAKQGGEIASAFWGNRPGLAEDVQSFKRLVDDQPGLMGQFRSMVTTHGASTADGAKNLTVKFSKWVQQTLPGLREAFSPEEVQTLQRIAQDIDRAAKAAKLGTSPGGSNTYQNAANALDLGLLDSAGVDAVAGKVPMGRTAVDFVRDKVGKNKSARMAELLADSGASANAIEQLLRQRQAVNGPNAFSRLVAPSVYRGAPRSIPPENR